MYSQELNRISQKISQIEQKYRYQNYLLSQFNEDNQSQETMIAYIKSTILN